MKRILRTCLVFVIINSLILFPVINAYAAEGLAFPTSDLIAPEVISPPVKEKLQPGVQPTINATVTDNVGVKNVTIFYRDMGETNFQRTEMIREAGTNNYSATLPEVVAPGLEYYIQATDRAGNSLLHGHTFSPLTLNVLADAAEQQDEIGAASQQETTATSEKGVSKWVWITLGVLAVGALAGGGGGGGGSNPPPSGEQDGSLIITGPTPQ